MRILHMYFLNVRTIVLGRIDVALHEPKHEVEMREKWKWKWKTVNETVSHTNAWARYHREAGDPSLSLHSFYERMGALS